VSKKLPLNLQSLDQLRSLERERPGLIKELIRLFVADAPKQMRLIEGAYRERDPERLRQSAHFLRSGALALGLGWLAEQGRMLEHLDLANYGQPDADELLSGLRGELHSVLLALLKELQADG
jgi:HPt (histidine-containing phosphotransfer) domain-containing protein